MRLWYRFQRGTARKSGIVEQATAADGQRAHNEVAGGPEMKYSIEVNGESRARVDRWADALMVSKAFAEANKADTVEIHEKGGDHTLLFSMSNGYTAVTSDYIANLAEEQPAQPVSPDPPE